MAFWTDNGRPSVTVASFWGLSQALRGSQAKIALAHSALAWAQIASIPILVVAQMIFLVNFVGAVSTHLKSR